MSKPISKLAIRPAELRDCAAVLRLQDELFPGDPNALDEAGAHAVIGAGQPMLFVAELAGEIVGFTLLTNRGTRPWTGIDFVGVSSAASGRGIGQQLTELSLLHVPRPIARLFVRPTNVAARALYKHTGFRQTGMRKASYDDGEDALIMMKWLGFKRFRAGPKG